MSSFTNFIGIGLKLQWLLLERKKNIIDFISNNFFSNSRSRFNVGLNIYEMILKNMNISNYSLGFAKSRLILTAFEKEALNTIFFNTKHIIMMYMRQIFHGDNSSIESSDLESSLEVMNLVLNYPFNICYMEFTAESATETNSPINYPESWKDHFIDVEYITGLIELLKCNHISNESKLYLVKNLSRICSCKKSLIPSEMEANSTFIHFVLEMPNRMIQCVPMDDGIYIEELVELMERSIAVYTINKLMEHNEKSELWVKSLITLCQHVMAKNYKLTEKVYLSMNNIFKNISVQTTQVYYEIAVREYLNQYFTILFKSNTNLNIFSDLTYNQHMKFKEIIDERFKVFSFMYSKYKDAVGSFILLIGTFVFEEFEKVMGKIKAREINGGNVGGLEREITLYLSIFMNYMFFVSNTVLYEGGYSYGKPKTPPKIDGISIEDVEGMVLGSLFRCISFIESFFPYIDKQTRINIENSIVYYFHSFLSKISKDIFHSKSEPNILDCRSSVYISCMRYQTVFDSLEKYLILSINKCLGNLSLGEKVVGSYSIAYLKSMIENLKKHLQMAEFNTISIPSHISKELLNINSTNLSDPAFYKLRSDLYEIISICYLEEQRDDYIENIHQIINRIFQLDIENNADQNVGFSSYAE